MLIIINIFLPIIISTTLNYSILFKTFTLQYLKIFLGIIVIWFITILFNNSVKNFHNILITVIEFKYILTIDIND